MIQGRTPWIFWKPPKKPIPNVSHLSSILPRLKGETLDRRRVSMMYDIFTYILPYNWLIVDKYTIYGSHGILYTISKTNMASENRPGLDPGIFPSSILIGIFRGYVAGMVHWRLASVTSSIPRLGRLPFYIEIVVPKKSPPSLKPLKIDGWKVTFLLAYHLFRCYFSFREGKCCVARGQHLLSSDYESNIPCHICRRMAPL